MPLRSMGEARRRAEAGVELCTVHGSNCKKYPDHPAVRERNKPDTELAEMVRTGRLLGHMKELADAGYELPEEFTRGNEDPPKGDRVQEFFERYDLGKHFPWDKREPTPCKPRKLSDDELRQRTEWAKAVREARSKKGFPDPLPPWENLQAEAKLADRLLRGRAEFRRQREAEKAERATRLIADPELARKMREALETWVNSAPRNRRHIQDVREGYGDAVPEFEEIE